MKKKKKRKFALGPVFTIIFLTMLVILLSAVLSMLGIEGQQTLIRKGVLETSLITIQNVLTPEGLHFLFGNIINNLMVFEPLIVFIIALIGIGIGEKSGLFKAIFTPFKNWKSNHITMLTLFVGIVASFFGEQSYAFFLPLAGVFYKYAGKNSRLGILTMFLGLSTGYGTGLIFNHTDYLLGTATQISASLEVDQTYQFQLFSTSYIMLASTFLLTIFGTMIIEHFLTPKFPKKTPLLEEETPISKKGLLWSTILFVVFVLIVVYGIVPGIPGSGFLLDNTSDVYIAKLMGTSSPFAQSFIFLLTLLLMICGFAYGMISKNISSTNDYSLGLAKGFENTGYVFVLLFFVAQLVAILEWSKIGEVLSARMIQLISTLPFSGIPLILTFFFLVILMGILIPSTEAKWTLLNPLVIPLFMRSNITPDFTQFIYRVSDGLSHMITPLFGYFIIMLALLQKYNYDEEKKITIFGTLKLILPAVLWLIGLSLLIILGWYVIDLPIGIGTYSTL